MLFLLFRTPPPDAPYWPGRRRLAVLDALAWPLMWLLGIATVAFPFGLVGWVVASAAVWNAGVRCHRAIWLNHRYRFTTWRWGRAILALVALGLVLKVVQTF